jgi:hypothetical protein
MINEAPNLPGNVADFRGPAFLVGNKKARHREPTAHARARYRCFLPDLAGLARVRRVGPIPDPS